MTDTTKNPDGTTLTPVHPTAVSPISTRLPLSPWGESSGLGSSFRAATDIRMSTYDTDPTSTDQTAAITAALAAAADLIANHSIRLVRIILDSRQKYIVGGALINGANGEQAQIVLPYIASATQRGVIKFVGIPRGNDFSIYGGRSSTVIESTLSAAPAWDGTKGIASTFGGPASYCNTHNAGLNTRSRLTLAFQDVTIRSANPVICGVDAGFIDGLLFDGVLQFDTDAAANGGSGVVANSNRSAIPVIFPQIGCGIGTIGSTLCIVGWLCGPVMGDMVHVNRYVAFFLSGAIINVGMTDQVARFDYITEWGCGYGIGAIHPSGGGVFSFLPSAGTDAGHTTIAGLSASPIHIGSWNVQTVVINGQGGVSRVYDVMDANNALTVDALFDSTTYGFARNLPIILGSGGSTTGFVTRHCIRDTRSQLSAFATNAVAVPASGVAIRNPFARNALVTIVGGTVSAVAVDTVAMQNPNVVLVPANGIISVTYTVVPTWQWTTI